VLYAALFLAAGSSLLALTYTLLADRLPTTSTPIGQLPAICKELPLLQLKVVKSKPSLQEPKIAPLTAGVERTKGALASGLAPPDLKARCKAAFTAGARAGSGAQRDRALHSLLLASLIGLGLMTVASAGLGWLLAGRALRPVRDITEAARRASALHLGERIALAGPADELKDLADTFDEMLERLDAAFRSQKRFVANAAHELRTPLTAMRTSIEVTLSKPSRTPDQLEAMAAKVRRSLARTEATVDALLTLATSEQGTVSREPVDLATATEDALDGAAASITNLKLTLEKTLEPARTEGDPVLLERMVANLVENAVRHNEPQGWIRVRTGEHNGTALFEIANSGPHVPEASIPALFEPFGRSEQRLNPSAGLGLGLSIANAIAIAHGATISAHSRAEGGLNVAIRLPKSAATSPELG
jgi:signal transduction histidine kinase